MGIIQEAWQNTWEPTPNVPIYQWAKYHVELGPPYTKSGKFDVSSSRHLIALFDSFQSLKIRETNVLAPVRGAKTLFADISHLWTIKVRPAPTLFLFQDDKAAKDQSELRTWPNIYRCETVRKLLSGNRHKNRNMDIIFPHMVFHIRGPAKSNLQSRGYQNVWLDEPWQYKGGKMEEARGRLGDFVKTGTDKLVCLSQGGIVGEDWDRQYNRGVIHEWHVQCMACGHYMIPSWSGSRPDGSRWGMRFDTLKLPSGMWDIPRVLPTVRFECEKCGHGHQWGTRTKNEWNRTGKYVVEAAASEKLPSKESFHWTAVIDYPWDQLVDLYLQAINSWKLGTPEALIQFFQKRMAEMSSEERLLENGLNFTKARYEISSKPENAVRILTADRQEEDVYWVMARDWFPTTPEKLAHTRRIWYGKCYSASEIEKKREEFGIHPRHVLIDSGFKPKGDHGVYAYCIEYGWVPTKGDATEGGEEMWFTHSMGDGIRIQRSYSEPVIVDSETRGNCQMVRFSAPTYTARVQELIDRGLWIEPEGMENDPMDRECRKQMAAEFQREIMVGNKLARRAKKVWVCPSRNNHARDCAKQQVLAAVLLEILPDLEASPQQVAA